MRAIGYFRSITGRPSFPEFESAFHEYCDLNLHQPLKVFGDTAPAEDGSYGGYDRMLLFMREEQSEFLVVVPTAGHLGDDLESVARSVVGLERSGAKVACADEELPDPLQNALETLGVKGVSQSRSYRIRESMRARAIRGKGLGKPPFGYRNGQDGRLEVVPVEAVVVRLIYRLSTEESLGLRLIAQHLNERGVPTRRGGKWNMATIRDILRNQSYIGTYTRFGLSVPKSHDAIIQNAEFRAAQDRTRRRRRSVSLARSEPFLFSGMAYCGYCGNKMMGVTRRQSWRRKDGRRASGVYRYYQCQSRNNQSVCGYHTWRTARLEETVLAQLGEVLRPASGPQAAPERSARNHDVQAMWDGQVANAERRLVRAIRRTSRGELSTEALGVYIAELDEVRRVAAGADRRADVTETLENWASLPISAKKGFLMEHLVRIVVEDESIEVVV